MMNFPAPALMMMMTLMDTADGCGPPRGRRRPDGHAQLPGAAGAVFRTSGACSADPRACVTWKLRSKTRDEPDDECRSCCCC